MRKARKTGAVKKRGKAAATKATPQRQTRVPRVVKSARKAAKKLPKKPARKPLTRASKKLPKKPARKGATKAVQQAARKSPPPPRFEAHALDPLRKCGAATSVQLLYRVDELSESRSLRAHHLVFFDRHGWYCDEHGRTCPALTHAQQAARKLGSTEPITGPTQLGRTRA